MKYKIPCLIFFETHRHIEHIAFNIFLYATGHEKTYRTEVVILIKIFNFYQNNNFGPKKPFPHAF